MKAIILVAEKGRGKTTEAFDIVKQFSNKDLYVYDRQGQYKHFTNNKIKGLPSMEQFLQIIKPVKNAVIIFEEATIFFSNKGREEIVIEKLVSNFHESNVIVFIFHSIRTIPIEIADQVDFMKVWHTNDRRTLIANKYKDDQDFLDLLLDVHDKTYGTEKNRETGEYADERSKNFYHYNRVYSR